jgi:hypothetical protein
LKLCKTKEELRENLAEVFLQIAASSVQVAFTLSKKLAAVEYVRPDIAEIDAKATKGSKRLREQ